MLCSDPQVSAGEIKRLSRQVQLIPNWEAKKLIVMKDCLFQKYIKQPFKELLLKTDDAEIIEGNWWGDKFWGVCLKTNEGHNMLGKMIMEIRTKLQSNDKSTS